MLHRRQISTTNKKRNKISILLLWAPLADYTVACLEELSRHRDLDLYIVHQPVENDAPYDRHDLRFFREVHVCHKETEQAIEEFCLDLQPDVIMMSSWNYPLYMTIARKCKARGSLVISSFDGQWRSTLKQRLGIIVSGIFLKPAIDNFFVPGDRQATFARKLGYKNPLQGYYSARTESFRKNQQVSSANLKRFIFVGRLVSDKGVESLITAYKEYRRSTANPWDLIIVGKGHLMDICMGVEGVIIKDFVQPRQLPEILAQATCLVLPSNFEPWGVVIHEAVTSGLSVICSHACGASTMFVRDGQNGYIIHPDSRSLTAAMKKMSAKTDAGLNRMSETSKLLASLWTTQKWADYVYENICSPVKYSHHQ